MSSAFARQLGRVFKENEKPSIANPRPNTLPNTLPNVDVNFGHSGPISKLRIVPVSSDLMPLLPRRVRLAAAGLAQWTRLWAIVARCLSPRINDHTGDAVDPSICAADFRPKHQIRAADQPGRWHLVAGSDVWGPSSRCAGRAAQISTTSMRASRPAKSAALRVTTGSPFASATAATSRSANRRLGLRPCARTAA